MSITEILAGLVDALRSLRAVAEPFQREVKPNDPVREQLPLALDAAKTIIDKATMKNASLMIAYGASARTIAKLLGITEEQAAERIKEVYKDTNRQVFSKTGHHQVGPFGTVRPTFLEKEIDSGHDGLPSFDPYLDGIMRRIPQSGGVPFDDFVMHDVNIPFEKLDGFMPIDDIESIEGDGGMHQSVDDKK